MIRQLRGQLVESRNGMVVLDVSGVGYQIAVTKQPTLNLGSELTLHTYLAVRETALDLYGFETRDELEIFELLITLPKVGPKSALQILAQADIELLKKAVLNQDASYLSKMSGIGKKTAEKIVHELAEKFAERYDAGAAICVPLSQDASDVIDALIALGYSLPDARTAATKIPPNLPTSEAVREALKQLG